MTSKQVRISDLDFDKIKDNLKNYLQGQSEFSDYNFEGSALSTVLDVLSYNTHYNSYYLNMAFNELFLDTAVKRSSIVSRAKELGYTPYSCKAATAVVDIIIDATDNPNVITLLRDINSGAQFTGYDNNQEPYRFIPAETYVTEINEDGKYIFKDVILKEGRLGYMKYVYNSISNPNSIFELPHDDIDLSTLIVSVKTNEGSSVSLTYQRADTIEEVTGSSLVYFIQENQYGVFEMYFGNNVIGRQLENGNVIEVDFLITNKAAANGIKSFFVDGGLINGYDAYILPKSAAFGGSEKETDSQIKMNAPKHYLARNRAVTALDFQSLIMSEFSDVEDVKVWGGENNTPKKYGYVFVSMKPVDSFNYPISYLNSLVHEFLKKKKMLTTNIEFVQPDYLYVTVDTKVTYDQNKTTFSGNEFKLIIASQIQNNYFNYQLEKFDTNFYHSKLVQFIDNLSPAILSNLTTIKLQRRIYPTAGTKDTYDISFWNSLLPGTVKSTKYLDARYSTTKLVYFADSKIDEEVGNINLYDSEFNSVIEKIGSINYKTGAIIIDQLVANNTYNDPETIYIDATPVQFDITTSQNLIITANKAIQQVGVGLNNGINITVVAK